MKKSIFLFFAAILCAMTLQGANGTTTVYFKNTVNWGKVYVYFYKGEYWSDSNGSGSSTGGNCASGPLEMIYDEELELYKYTYTGTYTQYISFTKDKQDNYGNFWQTEAVYRTDYNANTPVYVPSTTSSGTKNSNVKYYNNGSWEPLLSEGTITVYFNNTVNWSNVYVYFYKGEYWSDSNGSGSSTGGNCISGPNKMTYDSNLKLYKYTYTGKYCQNISFTKDEQSNYGNFWQTEAVYRTDFNSEKPVYTPKTTSSGTLNQNVKYYNTGSWDVLKYSVTIKNDGNGTTDPSGEQSNVTEADGLVIKATALENYEFVNWTITTGTGSFDNENAASTTFYPTSNTTIQANFRSTLTYSLTVQGGTGIESVTGDNNNVTLGESYAITATLTDGYKFVGWTADVAANAEIANASAASTSVVVKNGSVVLTASATEITSTLTTANTYSEGTPDIAAPTASVSKVGVATTATITAASNAAYALTSWTLTNCERTDGRAANATEITIKGLGNDNEASVVANYTKIPEETVYFVNNKEWNTVNAYAWNKPNDTNNGWPGVAATKTEEKVAGFDVYSFTAIEGQYTNVIFNDGGFQTADLVWTAGKYYWMGAETDFAGATKEEVEEALAAPVVYESVYFVNAEKWTAVNIYTWSPNVASWPGVAMTKEAEQLGGYDVYSYTIEKGTTFGGFNFNEGDQKRKTDDLTWTAGKYYVIDNWYTKAEAEAKLATLVKYDYYITGSLVGGWNPDQQGLVKDGELYKATFTELNAGTYEFKITAGDWEHQWNYSNLGAAYEEVSQGVDNEGNPNGNIKIVTEEAKNITVIFDAIAGKITFEGLTQISGGTTTSLDNLNTTVAPVKVIENGQLFVIKNGVKYNVLGAIVK